MFKILTVTLSSAFQCHLSLKAFLWYYSLLIYVIVLLLNLYEICASLLLDFILTVLGGN